MAKAEGDEGEAGGIETISKEDSAAPRFKWAAVWQYVGWAVLAPVAILYVIISASQVARASAITADLRPRFALEIERALAPFRTVNDYGLFAHMTTKRPELIIEGSRDGQDWKPYEFRWKPGDVTRAPAFVAPHMPRLDWQMWFAALNPRGQAQWLGPFLVRLLEGAPEVTALMAQNPFRKEPPRYVRVVMYEYTVPRWEEWAWDGVWWKRERVGVIVEPLRLPGN